jgi:alpha-L-fucosidase
MSSSALPVPCYLQDHAALWATDPRAANRAWWQQAKLGLFIHYGLYSQLAEHEWVQFRRQIPVAQYARLKDNFTAHRFDADVLTDLALEAEMKYVNLVTCHHESFCLWNSKAEPFNSANSPCGRDLVAELAAACARKGLGFFTYYTFMLNWRHPYFLSRDEFAYARPAYEQPQPEYLYRNRDDFRHYLDYVRECLTELLTGYGPLAGMWLDLIMAWYLLGPEVIPIEEFYALIRARQPQTMVSWKQGATGTEDFGSPEQHFHSLEDRCRQQGGEAAALRARVAWAANQHKHNEICATLQPGSWGFNAFEPHRSAQEVYNLVGHALAHNCNLLLNVGPLADGSLHPTQVRLLRELGARIRKDGWPQGGVESKVPGSAPAA